MVCAIAARFLISCFLISLHSSISHSHRGWYNTCLFDSESLFDAYGQQTAYPSCRIGQAVGGPRDIGSEA